MVVTVKGYAVVRPPLRPRFAIFRIRCECRCCRIISVDGFSHACAVTTARRRACATTYKAEINQQDDFGGFAGAAGVKHLYGDGWTVQA